MYVILISLLTLYLGCKSNIITKVKLKNEITWKFNYLVKGTKEQ